MLLNLPKRAGGGVVAAFPYTFPLLSIKATTGSAADWTTFVGNLYQQGATENWITSNTADRSKHYQDFPAGATREAVIDAGNARIDISQVISTFTDDDGVHAFVEFFDGSSGFLGHGFTPNSNPSSEVTDSKTDIVVPPGTRTFRIGWQGAREGGTELSAYVKDLTCTIKEASSPWDDAVVAFSEFDANITGWTITNSGFAVLSYAAGDWEWQCEDCYAGGGSDSYTAANKAITIPTGWDTKIATGNVRALIRCTFHNANDDDDAGIGLRFNDGATNPVDETGRTAIGSQAIYIEHDAAVPSATTSIDIMAQMWRDDGSYNDAAISKISVILYEVIP